MSSDRLVLRESEFAAKIYENNIDIDCNIAKLCIRPFQLHTCEIWLPLRSCDIVRLKTEIFGKVTNSLILLKWTLLCFRSLQQTEKVSLHYGQTKKGPILKMRHIETCDVISLYAKTKVSLFFVKNSIGGIEPIIRNRSRKRVLELKTSFQEIYRATCWFENQTWMQITI